MRTRFHYVVALLPIAPTHAWPWKQPDKRPVFKNGLVVIDRVCVFLYEAEQDVVFCSKCYAFDWPIKQPAFNSLQTQNGLKIMWSMTSLYFKCVRANLDRISNRFYLQRHPVPSRWRPTKSYDFQRAATKYRFLVPDSKLSFWGLVFEFCPCSRATCS